MTQSFNLSEGSLFNIFVTKKPKITNKKLTMNELNLEFLFKISIDPKSNLNVWLSVSFKWCWNYSLISIACFNLSLNLNYIHYIDFTENCYITSENSEKNITVQSIKVRTLPELNLYMIFAWFTAHHISIFFTGWIEILYSFCKLYREFR